MPRITHLFELEHGKILAYKEEGLNISAIESKASRSVDIVNRFLDVPQSCEEASISGRPRKIPEKAERRLVLAAGRGDRTG